MNISLLRLEELIIENKKLYNVNLKLKQDLQKANDNNDLVKTKITELENLVLRLKDEKCRLEKEIKQRDIAEKNHVLFMQNQFKRKDALNNKLVGSNKDKREIELKNEVNALSSKNNVLYGFIKKLFAAKNLDFNLFYKLVENEVENIDIFVKEF